MKRLHLFSLLIIAICAASMVTAQEAPSFRSHEIKLQAGISRLTFRDTRISAQTKSSWAPTYGMNYIRSSNSARQEFSMTYAYKSKYDSERLLDMTYHIPTIGYSYERRVGDNYMGGYFESSMFLILPQSNSGIFNNNPVSYSMFMSLGPKVSFDKQFGGKADSKFALTGTAQASLLSYNVRPAYGHPYPEKFLETGTFSPTRRGMAGPLMKSGRIQTIDKHQSIQLKLGAYYFVSESIKIGVDVRLSYVNNNTLHDARFQTGEFLLGVGYVY